jgi:hypothetical protein
MFTRGCHYSYRFLRKQYFNSPNSCLEKSHYDFRDSSNIRYMVEVEQYAYQVFVVKFYPKYLALYGDKKFQLLTNNNAAVSRIILTCIEIMLEILRKYPNASFGFLGARLVNEHSADNTKRFRLYSIVMASVFSPVNFEHHQYTKESCYLMLSKKMQAILPDLKKQIEDLFLSMYILTI